MRHGSGKACFKKKCIYHVYLKKNSFLVEWNVSAHFVIVKKIYLVCQKKFLFNKKKKTKNKNKNYFCWCANITDKWNV